ncbi:hypothetical protein [Salibacterium lacus]|uniref:Uncharacterized protein n=1 Tax=Salibacterium lacus TaxID=1898109 RepID=A0ABW5T051_9BACI
MYGRHGTYKVVIAEGDRRYGKDVKIYVGKRDVYSEYEREPEWTPSFFDTDGELREKRRAKYEEDMRVYADPIELTKRHVKAYEAQLDEQFTEESRRMAWGGDVYEDDDVTDISEGEAAE